MDWIWIWIGLIQIHAALEKSIENLILKLEIHWNSNNQKWIFIKIEIHKNRNPLQFNY